MFVNKINTKEFVTTVQTQNIKEDDVIQIGDVRLKCVDDESDIHSRPQYVILSEGHTKSKVEASYSLEIQDLDPKGSYHKKIVLTSEFIPINIEVRLNNAFKNLTRNDGKMSWKFAKRDSAIAQLFVDDANGVEDLHNQQRLTSILNSDMHTHSKVLIQGDHGITGAGKALLDLFFKGDTVKDGSYAILSNESEESLPIAIIIGKLLSYIKATSGREPHVTKDI